MFSLFRPRIFLLIWGHLSLIGSPCQAQNQTDFLLEQLTAEDGLLDGFVTGLYQDSLGFIWMGTPRGLHRFDGYSFKYWLPTAEDSTTISHNEIWALFGESDGTLWVGTDGGLNHFNPATDQFTRYLHDTLDQTSLSHNRIVEVNKDHLGHIWVGTKNGLSILSPSRKGFTRFGVNKNSDEGYAINDIIPEGDQRMWFIGADTLFCYEFSTQQYLRYPLPNHHSSNENMAIEMLDDELGTLWVGTSENGLFRFNKIQRKFTEHYPPNPSDPKTFDKRPISTFAQVNGHIWAGLYGGGLNIFSPETGLVERFETDPFNPVHLNMSVVRSLLIDQQENIWMGTFKGGAKIIYKNRQAFYTFKHIPGLESSIFRENITNLFEQEDGRVLVLGEQHYTFFDPVSKSFEKKIPLNISGKSVPNNLIRDYQGNLWLVNGVLHKKPSTSDEWERISDPLIEDKLIMFVYEDRNHLLWIGTQEGLFTYTPESEEIARFPLAKNGSKINPGSNQNIFYFNEEQNGNLWINTPAGTNYYTLGDSSATFYPYKHKVYSIREASDGNLWIGTSSGIATFDRKEQIIKPAKRFSKIQDGDIGAVYEDQLQRIWAFGQKGWYCVDTMGNTRLYTPVDGLLNMDPLSGLQTKSGEIYVGGSKGLYFFNPEDIQENTFIPKVAIVDMKVRNQSLPITHSSGDTIPNITTLPKSITYLDQLELPHWQNDFALEFSSLDFGSTEKSTYEFQLLGFEAQPTITDAKNRAAYYTNLDWGTYTFRVRATNGDGIWGDYTTLKITIHPPWWATWWAYFLYAILFISGFYAFYRFQLKRQLAEAEAKRLKDLDLIKNQLYTNITHEFRTPLTVMLGMADQLKSEVTEAGKTYIKLIKRNGEQLLNLVNQMLDLSKVESGALDLNLQQGDVVNYIRYLVESFHSFAQQEDIRLHFHSELEQFDMDYDALRLQQILSNLLSNAIKFTPNGGNVYLDVKTNPNKTTLTIQVRDTGIGITEAQLPFIFDRFHQADASSTRQGEGTGIGLALTKELVKLMDGQIEAKSTIGKGSTFTVKLPIQQQAPFSNTRQNLFIPKPYLQEVAALHSDHTPFRGAEAPTLLLIEDNPDVVTYLIAVLNDRYHIEVAYNGQQGIDKAIQLIPDLIISDVMMPQKNGFEVCHTLKMTEQTSHIPIILLTAKADMDSKLAGYAKGADAYLPKPFYKKELLIRIQQLLQTVQRLQTYYQSRGQQTIEVIPNLSTPDVNPKELEFLEKVRFIVLDHLPDDTFTVAKLAKAIYYSEPQLNRKLKGITGLTPGKYIRSVRIEQAKILLKDPNSTVTSVAFDAGFQNPEYFSKIFKKEVGQTPSEYRQG